MFKLIIFDFDGVFTDGKIIFDSQGNAMKHYHAKDGLGIFRLHDAGFEIGVISGWRENESQQAILNHLKIKRVSFGSNSKLEILDQWCKELNITLNEVAYMGDDLNDIKVMKEVKLVACPNNAVEEVKEIANIVCEKNGGEGSVREFCEYLIKIKEQFLTDFSIQFTVSIIGLGFVGMAMKNSFDIKNIKTLYYDKFKDGGIGNLDDILESNICFLCLPTLFDEKLQRYNTEEIIENCQYLNNKKYNGLVVIKSTVEPETCVKLSEKYRNLKIVHNPEFLSAKTSFCDFHNQKHIIIGKTDNESYKYLKSFYNKYYTAEISICSSIESELTKLYLNNFYASKIQLFNELYLLTETYEKDVSWTKVRRLMLKNNWINPMHTNVPGNDGLLSYGGYCFPKDTKALLSVMINKGTRHKVLKSVIEERQSMR